MLSHEFTGVAEFLAVVPGEWTICGKFSASKTTVGECFISAGAAIEATFTVSTAAMTGSGSPADARASAGTGSAPRVAEGLQYGRANGGPAGAK
jgi:hypothetical protein